MKLNDYSTVCLHCTMNASIMSTIIFIFVRSAENVFHVLEKDMNTKEIVNIWKTAAAVDSSSFHG